ncbi:LPS biosynthesis protein WbpP [Salipaludibacillus neizhouensis]|uniref:LPS biosynthesis protein WbpP n=1 Tax=Salipaludibacillus neizhouensis TaxID=885475 RepID=A0A3A9KCJ6_9BACI|nr:SDR family oxidoreductase [Salipaludibacillus neizhouensis]RKL68221.1 LPS biosynthesis protein WbpP [Salipaludibacillus neizhouensis]
MILDRFKSSDKFLITGGAGFIGSNLADFLLQHGFEVKVLDDYSNGRHENIKDLKSKYEFEFIEGDIRDLETCKAAVKGVDYVLHQAAWGSVPRSIRMPLVYDEVNIHGTLNMLEAAKDAGVKKFVYASSSSVYGDEPTLPKVEGREGKPLSPYAITKKVNELYAKNYFELYGLETVGLRYFNVFGRRQDPHSTYAAVIPIFIRDLLKDQAPNINGDGSQTRDFTYIDNVIEANLLACLAGTEASGEAFNIAYGKKITLNELYEIICKLLDKEIKPNYREPREGDIPHSLADISKTKKLLGYDPKIDVFEGLERTMAWYVENLGAK